MVRRFNYGGDEDRDDTDQFYDHDDEEMEVSVDPAFVAMIQADLMSESLDQNLLNMAIEVTKDSTDWNSNTLKKKLKMISEAYTTLSQLIHPQDEETPEE